MHPTLLRPRPALRQLALVSALLATGAAQAAGLQLGHSSLAGQFTAQAGAHGTVHDSSAALVDNSSPDVLALAGSLDETATLGAGPSTQLHRRWSAGALLDASAPAAALFQIGAVSVLDLSGDGGFDGGSDSSSLVLNADLRIVATAGEAAGTPVRLVFSGTASSLIDSTGPALDTVPFFDLVLSDATGSILASWQGLDAGGSASFDFSLDSRVGETLNVSLHHASTSLLGSATVIAATGDSLSASALLSGSVLVTAVPEPESYALLLAGLATLGLLRSRSAQRRD